MQLEPDFSEWIQQIPGNAFFIFVSNYCPELNLSSTCMEFKNRYWMVSVTLGGQQLHKDQIISKARFHCPLLCLTMKWNIQSMRISCAENSPLIC